ncbi:MAG: MotA/TolQ/ExbB proton channel family protein [Blastochloris sp.]|mgnify:CR=1 FL=1|jgi:biopolymer transport protein ExbB|nr:MotA/TolQ/ExbB proton channel family protein [Blastochloris sp.]
MYFGKTLRSSINKSLTPIFTIFTLLTFSSGAHAAEAGKQITFMDILLNPSAEAVVLWILIAASIAMLTWIIELFIKLRKDKLAPPAVIALLRDAIASGNYQMAYEVCVANPSFLSNIMQAAFENIGLGKHGVEESMNENFAKQAVRLKSRNNYLSVIGVTAPMIGLTGTVLGMMKAFAVLGQSGVANMTGLSSAISEVLIATASGLGVAIPAFIFFYYFKNAMTTAFADVHAEAKTLLRPIPFDQLQGYGVDRKR